MREIELLELAVEIPQLAAAIKQHLNLSPKDEPFDVPLEVLDWRKASVRLLDDDGNAVDEISTFAVQLKQAAVGRDSDGNLFLARKGDYLLRHNNAYSLLRGRNG